jgi:hypothetical protein
MGLVVMLGLGGAGTAWVLTRPDPAPAVAPARVMLPEVATVDPPVLIEVDAGLPVDAGVAEADAGATRTPGALEAGDSLDGGLLLEVLDATDVKPVKVKNAPTVKQLKDRINKLSARAKRKKNLDPTALPFLGRYRSEAAAADAARRVRLDKALTDWERTFLKK